MQIHQLDPQSPLPFEQFRQILADNDGPITFRATTNSQQEESPGDTFPEDILLNVSYPGVSQRGNPLLIHQLWLEFPKVATLLEYPLWHVGSVTFSAKLREQARNLPPSNLDPVTAAVIGAIQQSKTLKAILPSKSPDSPATHPAHLAPAAPSKLQTSWGKLIQSIRPKHLLDTVASPADAQALLAGLLLWHDLLDESHKISQFIEGEGHDTNGDYWHAIMHRREPDFGNAKYWFRRVGPHPIHPDLADHARRNLSATPFEQIGYNDKWSPTAFVDACQSASRSADEATDLALRQCQADEILLLLLHTCRSAQ